MIACRKGLFETNSSSSHSIVLSRKPYTTKDKLMVEDGICTIYEGEFGWEVEDYYDANTKASYLWTWISRIARENDRDRFTEQLRKVIMDNTKCDKVIFDSKTEGYIDHQSADEAEVIFDRDHHIANFIFNPHSVLHTDNDNH